MGLTAPERKQLAQIIGCSVKEFAKSTTGYADAAKEEYFRMILGQRVFTRGSDIREYRLLLLIQYVFTKRLPTEQQICNLFQTSTSQSRALLRAVLSKYQYLLHEILQNSLRQLVAGAVPIGDTDDRTVTIDSECEIDALNRKLTSLDGTLPQVSKAKGMVGSYEIKASSYAKLTEAFAS
jgi:hypothetical protein